MVKQIAVVVSIKAVLLSMPTTLSTMYLIKELGKLCSPNLFFTCHCQSVIGQ